MFPRHPDEIRHFDHHMSIADACRDAAEAIHRDPRVRVAVLLADGGGQVEGAWITAGRVVSVFDVRDGAVVRHDMSEGDVMAVRTVTPIESADVVLPGREQEALDQALVVAAFLQDDRSVASAYRRAGIADAGPSEDVLVGEGGAIPGHLVAGLRPDVRFSTELPKETRTAWLVAKVRERFAKLGYAPEAFSDQLSRLDEHAETPATDLPDDLAGDLARLVARSALETKVEEGLRPFMAIRDVVRLVSPYVVKA